MTRVPPEIDRLMWTLAEENNPGALDEFVRRYPIYREELARRRQAVSGLKTSRPAKPASVKPIPRFTPKEHVRPARKLDAAHYVVGTLVLAALGLASYTFTSSLTSHPTPPAPAPVVRTDPVQVPPTVVQKFPESAPPVQTPAPQPETSPPKDNTPKYLQPQTLTIKAAKLHDALNLIGAQVGLNIVIAPGLPDPTVAVDYHDVTAVEMLADLGRRYHFTPFDQGDGSVVIYPTIDPTDPAHAGPGNLRKLGG